MEKVSLSRPARASAPIAAPSRRPGFTAPAARQASAIVRARATSSSTSTPRNAAGTSPKLESAE